MNRRYSSLMIAAMSALVCGAVVLLSRAVLLDTLAAIPLVFILPGYALQNVLFVRARADWIERVVLTVALSLICAVLGAFLLDALPSKLNLFSWTLLLVGITLLGVIVAWFHRINQPLMFPLSPDKHWDRLPFTLSGTDLIKFSAAFVMVGVAVYIALTSATASMTTSRFTQFWLLPTPENHSIQIGLSNQEAQTMSYTVEIRNSAGRLRQLTISNLANQEQWTYTYTLPASQALPVEVLLYRSTEPDVVYRSTVLRSW